MTRQPKKVLINYRLVSSLIAFISIVFTSPPLCALEIKKVFSPNGIEAWLVRDSSLPMLTINFAFRGGYVYDRPEKAGLSNLVSSLLDEGAGKLDSATFQEQLQQHSIRMSFSAGRDRFWGSLKVLTTKRAQAIKLLRLALTKPRFDEEPIERIRENTLANLKRWSTNPHYIANQTWQKAVFGDHPYGVPSQGTRETNIKISRNDLVNFVAKRFARNLLIVGVAGDISPAELSPLLDQVFGDLPKRTTLPKLPNVDLNLTGQTHVIQFDVPQSSIHFGQLGLKRNNPSWYTLLIMNHILGGTGFSSRLYNEVREKRGLAYSVGTGLQPTHLAPLIFGRAATKNEKVSESLHTIRTEWQRMQTHGVTEAELSQAKAYLIGSFPLRFSSTYRIAQMLVSIQYYSLGINYTIERPKFIRAVTNTDISRLAKLLLRPNELTFVIVGKPTGVKPPSSTPKT